MSTLPLIVQERVDLYATRAAVIEIIRYLGMNDPGLLSHLRRVVALQPIPGAAPSTDVPLADKQLREALAALVKQVTGTVPE